MKIKRTTERYLTLADLTAGTAFALASFGPKGVIYMKLQPVAGEPATEGYNVVSLDDHTIDFFGPKVLVIAFNKAELILGHFQRYSEVNG
jgi:hypothetical protein